MSISINSIYMKLQNQNKKELYRNGSNQIPSSILQNKNNAASQLQKLLSFSKPFPLSTQAPGSERSKNLQREEIGNNPISMIQTAISESSMIKRTQPLQERQFIKAKDSLKYGLVQKQELSDPNTKQSTQSKFINKRTDPKTRINNQQQFRKIGLDKGSNTYDLSKQIAPKQAQTQRYQFRKKPTISEYTKSSQPQETLSKASHLAQNSAQVSRAISPNSKVRLRDYLFMINTSVSAAYRKKAEDIRQTKQISVECDSGQKSRTLEICRSNRSINITSRYHQQKYKVNKQELQYVLKSEINEQMTKLREHLQESTALLVRIESISEDQIPSWHELRRTMTEANKKIGEALVNLKSLTSTSESIVLEKTSTNSTKANQSFQKVTP